MVIDNHWLRNIETICFYGSLRNSGLGENMGCSFPCTLNNYCEFMQMLFFMKVMWPLLYDEPLDTILVITATMKLLLLLMVVLNTTIN